MFVVLVTTNLSQRIAKPLVQLPAPVTFILSQHGPWGLRRFLLTTAVSYLKCLDLDGVVAQLVEHHNGIVGVRGSNPLGSTSLRSPRSKSEGCRAEVRSTQAGRAVPQTRCGELRPGKPVVPSARNLAFLGDDFNNPSCGAF